MATSTNYWDVSSEVQSELKTLAGLGDDAHADLEATDDPGSLADNLLAIKHRLDKLSGQIGPNIAPLRKIAKALDDLPGMK